MGRHVVVATPPAPGHVFPVLGLVEELTARRDRVTMITSAVLASEVRAAGAETVELGWEPDTTRLADQEFSLEVLVADMVGYLDAVEQLLPGLLERLRADPPAVVCSDSVFLGPLLAGVFAAPSVSLVANFAMNEHVRPDRFVAGFDPGHPGLAQYGRRVGELFARYGLAAPDPRAHPVGLSLVFLPRAFQIAAGTFDDSFHFIGPAPARSRESTWTPPGHRPVVLVSMGTAFTRRPAVFTAAIDAFADTERHVVMAVGEHIEPDSLGPLPDNITISARVPQPAVLRHATAFVSHAGMGSVMEALLAQVPVVAIPHAAEQALNAERLAELGLGLHLPDPTPQNLRNAVDHVTTDPGIRTRLAEMRRTISAAGGAGAGADVVQSLATDTR